MLYELKSESNKVVVYMFDSIKDLRSIYDKLEFKEEDLCWPSKEHPGTFFYYKLLSDKQTRAYFLHGITAAECVSMKEFLESYVKCRICMTMEPENIERLKNDLYISYQSEHTKHRPEQAIKEQYYDICKINGIQYSEEGFEKYKNLLSALIK